MVKSIVAFVVVLFLSIDGWGCAPYAEPDGGRAPMMLSPDAELADDLAAAVDAWSAAAGIQALIGVGGIPVYVSDELEDCGSTYTARKERTGKLVRIEAIEIRRSTAECMAWPATLRHELGHALQQWASPDARLRDDGHTDSGLMMKRASGVTVVDEVSLSKVCSVATCTTFAPEGAL